MLELIVNYPESEGPDENPTSRQYKNLHNLIQKMNN